MRILLHRADGNTQPWVDDFAELLPQAEVLVWQEGVPLARCDYAVLWSPSLAMMADLAHVQAIFVTGAGVDAVLKHGDALPQVPIIRLADAGMAVQMAEYVTHGVLRYYRRFDEYEAQVRRGLWQPLPRYEKRDFCVGVLGAGVLGTRVIQALTQFGFPVRAWSRSTRQIEGVDCFAGMDSLNDFLGGTRVLVCMLPLTPETNNLLDRTTLSVLPQGAYVINVARGAQIAEPDLLALIRSGHIAGATLDVFRNEPLPSPHPFWQEPRITITPHVSALTMRRESIEQIVGKIEALERGESVSDIVNRSRGY